MPQSPIPVQAVITDGTRSTLNVNAAGVIKASPGRLAKITVGGTVGTGGSYTFNDCTTTAAAAAANQIFTTAGTLAVGSVIDLNVPCLSGITLSAFATGGAPTLAIFWE